jgi:hypothetical protein
MPLKKPMDVVGDPTNLKGTLRPNLHSEAGTGVHYTPLFCPEFNQVINLSTGINRTSPLAI